MKTYRDLFFDLDHTLWDFDTNARKALSGLFQQFGLAETFKTDEKAFIDTFFIVLHELWDEYNHSRITKDQLRRERFLRTGERLTRRRFAPLPALEEAYVRNCSAGGILLPGAIETLEYLKAKGYRLHILTNGFRESQQVKLETSGIAHFFHTVTTSECTGEKKPAPGIFNHALKQAGAHIPESLLVGDNPETDLCGAAAVRLDAVFFNPEQRKSAYPFTYQVQHLSELQAFL